MQHKSNECSVFYIACDRKHGGNPLATQMHGCLLSRGGPVSPRRNRNLGVERKRGPKMGPLVFCPPCLRTLCFLLGRSQSGVFAIRSLPRMSQIPAGSTWWAPQVRALGLADWRVRFLAVPTGCAAGKAPDRGHGGRPRACSVWAGPTRGHRGRRASRCWFPCRIRRPLA